MNKYWKEATLIASMALMGWAASAEAVETVTASDAWVRAAPPTSEINAAYLTLHNQTAKEQELVGVSSPQFQKAEIHATRVMNGMAHMQQLMKLTIPAHGSIEFKPGADHIMLIRPHHAPKTGDSVELRLEFKDTSPLIVKAPVQRDGDEESTHDMHHMDD